jgi:hypothetical protein
MSNDEMNMLITAILMMLFSGLMFLLGYYLGHGDARRDFEQTSFIVRKLKGGVRER